MQQQETDIAVKRLASLKQWLDDLDWRWLAAGGLALGLGGGLAGFLALDSSWWLPIWGVLFAGLTWLGWDAVPRLASPLIPQPAPKAVGRRLVRDGPFEMVELPGGEFLMGSPDQDGMATDAEKPQHPVRVSSFRIARTPVTARLYSQVTGSRKGGEDDGLPVTEVSWYRAIEFCNRLSRQGGFRPCYLKRGVWRWRRWVCDWTADGYRLPTEAEWEYACRAGTRTRYSFGDDPDLLGDFAWYARNSGGEVHSLATKRPNPWGLYDTHGNVWEWCWDRYGPYSGDATKDPKGAASGDYRVLRGGSFGVSPGLLRSAFRDIVLPEDWDGNIGFRCVRVPSPQR